MAETQRLRAVAAAIVVLTAVSCGGSGVRPALPGATPSRPVTATSPQDLYEAGRYREVVDTVNAGGATAVGLWFAGQSYSRLGDPAQAGQTFARLPAAGGTTAWQVVSDLSIALLGGDEAALDRAVQAASAFPADPLVQFELGLAYARRNDFAQAAQAFDRCSSAEPRFAYAYYRAGLAYDRLNRTDLAIARLETFARLAPQAPEQPEVAAILRTAAGR